MQVLGWGSEVDFVTSASRFGHQVLCSDYTTNVPVFSNFGLSPQELLPHRPSRRPPSRLTSRLSHITPPTTAPVNGSAASPAIGHGTTPKTAPALAAPKCTAAAGDTRHTATFMFTDGDSLTWDLGNFASSASDWWGSKWRGTVPIAWTFQPVLQELHPYFLRWVHLNATTNDTLLVGPSGAGYTYLDRYPDGATAQHASAHHGAPPHRYTYLDRYPDGPARARFGAWSSDNIERSGLLNMINQIQVWAPSTVQWSMCRHACMCSPRRPTLPNSGGHLRQCSGARAARAQHAARSPVH